MLEISRRDIVLRAAGAYAAFGLAPVLAAERLVDLRSLR